MSLKFNPPKAVGRYALFVDYGNGRGQFKTYNELAYAKLGYYAQGRRSPSRILEMVDGEWYTLFEIPANTSRQDLPWVKEVETGGWRNRYKTHLARPMTRDEYANWRIKVEHEKLGLSN